MMNFKMTLSCSTIVYRKIMYNIRQFQRAIPDDCTCSITEQNIAIHEHNDVMIRSIGQFKTKFKTKHDF